MMRMTDVVPIGAALDYAFCYMVWIAPRTKVGINQVHFSWIASPSLLLLVQLRSYP